MMEEKLRFVFEYERKEQTMTELCRRFEISREAGYEWLRRFRLHVKGLAGLNRAAKQHPNQSAARSRNVPDCSVYATNIKRYTQNHVL